MKSKHEICRTLGARIKELREKRNLTQKALAERVGIHVSFMGDLERGKKACGIEIAYWIAEALEVRVCELFVDDEYPKELVDFMVWYREHANTPLKEIMKAFSI
jgi:transcriptional regulator with XRE-family HTH domain